jgi:single-strand DNA-binding protein
MLNHIVIMGRLTRDPELRRTNSGTSVASFTVAVDRDFAQDGQDKETDFIDCVAWRQTGEFVSKYFAKGRMIAVSGRLQIRSWTDKDSNKRRSAEIVVDHAYFADSKKDDTQPSYGQPQNPTPQPNYGAPQYSTPQYGAQTSQYAQGGFAGYQQPAYPQQNYYPGYTPIENNEPLPF